MGAIRVTVAAVLMFAVAAVAAAQCVTDAQRISTRLAVPNLIAGPSAWSGFGLAVAKTEDGDPESIWIAVYDEMLHTLVPDTRVVTDGADRHALIDLVWNGFEYGLFYRADAALHLQRLSPSGTPVGSPIAIDPARPVRIRQPIEVAWSDTLNAWVLARDIISGSNSGLWAIIVERDWSVRQAQLLGSDPDVTPFLQIAVTGNGVIGVLNVSADDDALHFSRFVPGQSQFPPAKPIASSGLQARAAAIGNHFVVVRSAGDDIRWMVFDSSGAVVKEEALLVDAKDGDVAVPRALAAGNGELALTYGRTSSTNELDFRLLRFRVDGTIVSDTLFAAGESRARNAASAYPAVWSGTSWLIAASRDSAANGDSWIERYCPLVVEIFANPAVRLGQPATFRAFASGGAPGYAYQWSFTRDPGGFRNAEVVERTYGRTGAATATVTVTDASGETETRQFEFTVTDEPDPDPEPAKPRRRAVKK